MIITTLELYKKFASSFKYKKDLKILSEIIFTRFYGAWLTV